MTDTATPKTSARIPGASGDASRATVRFRPSHRRWNRIALGTALIAVAVAGNALVYTSLNDAEPVVQVVRDVPAGTQITGDMLRQVDATVDSSVNVIAGEQLDSVVGNYAKVRLVSGSLVTEQSVQPDPLVSSGSAIVAIQVADGAVPVGLRERVPVELVLPGTTRTDTVGEVAPPLVVPGRIVGLPTETSDALGTLSLSVEVAGVDGPTVAAADDVRVVLLSPSADPAAQRQAAPDAAVSSERAPNAGGDGG